MSTVIAMPRLPSLKEMEKDMRERIPGLYVYNPSREWQQLHVFGLTHLWACPDLGGAVEAHPITGAPVKCDGRSLIRGRYLDQLDSSGKNIEGQDTSSMVKFIVSPENYGQMGLVWLPGKSDEDDLKLMELSRKVYANFQRKSDEDIVAKRAEFKSNWSKGPHKSEPCPPPTLAESAAQDRLQQRRRAAIFRYECDVEACPGYATNEWEKFASHMKLGHGQSVKRERWDGEVSPFKDSSLSSSTSKTSSIQEVMESVPDIVAEVRESSPPFAEEEGDDEPSPSDRPVPRKKKSN